LLIWVADAYHPHVWLDRAKPLHQRSLFPPQLGVAHEDIDPDLPSDLERFLRIPRDQNAVTGPAQCLIDELLGGGVSLDNDNRCRACEGHTAKLPKNLAMTLDPDESLSVNARVGRRRPEHRRSEQAVTPGGRYCLEPGVRVQLPENAPQVIADRFCGER
jgi:hypothetical protein